MKRLSQKFEAHELTTDELLRRISKEQAIVLMQGLRRQIEESLNPDAPAAKTRVEKDSRRVEAASIGQTPANGITAEVNLGAGNFRLTGHVDDRLPFGER